jgi:hypothetical protein
MFVTSKVKTSQKFVRELTDGNRRFDLNEHLTKKYYIYYLKKGKKRKICMGVTRRTLQPQPKHLKNYRNIKSTNQNENFPKKSWFSTIKV